MTVAYTYRLGDWYGLTHLNILQPEQKGGNEKS
jgi:hypothetical protein